MSSSQVCLHNMHALCEEYVVMFAGRHGDASRRYEDQCECICHNKEDRDE